MGKKASAVKVTYRNIRELKPYKKNAKKHPKEQVERIMNSIKQFGFFEHRAVAIDSEDNVVEGHGRILAAKKAGLTQVPTICLDDMTEEQIKAWRLIENKTAESSYDETLINKEIEELLQSDIDMEIFGFSIDALEDETIEVEPDVPFTEILNEENNYIVLKFNNKIAWKCYGRRKSGKGEGICIETAEADGCCRSCGWTGCAGYHAVCIEICFFK